MERLADPCRGITDHKLKYSTLPMKKYSDSKIQDAINLRRKEKYSFVQLQKITQIPASTIRNWCKNERMGTKWDTLLATNERKRNEIINSERSVNEELKKINVSTVKLLVSLLYWCEGAKYPSSNSLAFVNSDPQL